MNTTIKTLAILAVLGLLFGVPVSAQKSAAQASLTLGNSDAQYSYMHNNIWSLTKTVDQTTITGSGTVTWTITAVKLDGGTTFTVHGGLTVTNTGSARATIGNIVLNLQKPNSPKKGSNASFVSIAADVADATNGDAATSANIAAAGSQENAATNAAWGTNNYTAPGAQGTFTEKAAGSGRLEFKDASTNTVFSLVPQPVIEAGQSITLLYDATFQPSVLPPAGTALRVEALVTFGNSGGRGGSGASAGNIDVNGNGIIDADEANVRTVPSRIMLAPLPSAPEESHASVTVIDEGVTTSGTATASNLSGLGNFPTTINSGTAWTVSAGVDSGSEGGNVGNEARLIDAGSNPVPLNVIIGYDMTDPLNPVPVYAAFKSVDEIALSASASVVVVPVSTPPEHYTVGGYCSYTQGGWGADPKGNNPGSLLAANFSSRFGTAIEAGVTGGSGYSMKFTSAPAIAAYLPAGGTAGDLNANLVNPTSSSSGVFGGQVLTLKLNVAMSDAGVTPAGFGSLQLYGTGTSLDGQSIAAVLGAADTALGGKGLPEGFTFSSLNDLITRLNESFDNCGTATTFAAAHLRK